MDRLRHREVEPEDRLAAAQSARREAIENRSDAENRLRALPGPLFTAESLRLRQILVPADREIARESAKIEKARRDLAKIAAERARRAADHRRSLARPRPSPGPSRGWSGRQRPTATTWRSSIGSTATGR